MAPRLTALGRRQADLSAAAVAADLGGRSAATVRTSDLTRAALAHLAGGSSVQAPWVEVPNGAVLRVDGRDQRWLAISSSLSGP